MSICPNCKEEIKELLAYSEVVGTFKLDKNGEPSCYGSDYIEGYTSFECPECNEKLFGEEFEAINFLENKDELQKMMVEKIKKDKEK